MRKLKIFMPKPNEGWIGDNTTDEFYDHTQHEIVYSIDECDIVYLYSKWIWNHFDISKLKSKIVVMTIHHIVPEKFNSHEFLVWDQFVDYYHVPNKKTRDFVYQWTKKPVVMLSYWINNKKWFTKHLDHKTQGLLNISPGKTVLASFQRDTEGSSIGLNKTPLPKLEKGPDIFGNIVEKFNNNEVSVVIPGWRRDYLVNRLKGRYDVISSQKLPDSFMNDLYNIVRIHNGIYLVTSRYEGGPQAIIEAAQIGCKILSTDVGIAVDILHKDCICRDEDEFYDKIKNMSFNESIAYNKNSVKRFFIDDFVKEYDRFLGDIYKNEIRQ